jgi:hypothetical protein
VATNFTFKGEQCDELSGNLALTNAMLLFSHLYVRQGPQEIRAPSGSFDLTERVVYVTNTITTMDPDLVTRVISPKVRAAVRPYHFQKPPTVRVNGRLPTVDIAAADVRFEVLGEDFSYWKLRLPRVSGDVVWRGQNLSITNVQASFYGGELTWQGDFDFSVPVGAQLSFKGSAQDADLHALMADLGKKTNDLEGSLSGNLFITSANSDDWRSWQGLGRLRLRNGFLWDIPIFGFFSPILNTIIPGLGKSRVSSGDASFVIDQSVINTRDLQVRSPALRLRYTGTVDFKRAVDARMRAEVLRDAWGIGRLVSFAFRPLTKALEYQINGTLDHPTSKPVYIPTVLLWPLQPLRTVKKLLHLGQPEPVAPPSPFEEQPEWRAD